MTEAANTLVRMRLYAPAADLMAATAKVHGLTLVTRNTGDFARTARSLATPCTGSSHSSIPAGAS